MGNEQLGKGCAHVAGVVVVAIATNAGCGVVVVSLR